MYRIHGRPHLADSQKSSMSQVTINFSKFNSQLVYQFKSQFSLGPNHSSQFQYFDFLNRIRHEFLCRVACCYQRTICHLIQKNGFYLSANLTVYGTKAGQIYTISKLDFIQIDIFSTQCSSLQNLLLIRQNMNNYRRF